jgi:hypothetical protein
MTTDRFGPGADDPLEEIYSLIESLKTMTDSLHEEFDDSEEDTDWRDEWAVSARHGDYGDDWRIIQRRIDREETTMDAVLMGEDQSPEAIRIRQTSEENLSRFEDDLDDDEKEHLDSLRDELSGAAQDLQERIERLTQQLKGL